MIKYICLKNVNDYNCSDLFSSVCEVHNSWPCNEAFLKHDLIIEINLETGESKVMKNRYGTLSKEVCDQVERKLWIVNPKFQIGDKVFYNFDPNVLAFKDLGGRSTVIIGHRVFETKHQYKTKISDIWFNEDKFEKIN